MAWWAEPAVAVWLQVAVFGGTAGWLLLATGVRACCVAASIPWITRADLAAASQATMSVGMAAMVIAML